MKNFISRRWSYVPLTFLILGYGYKTAWVYKKSFIVQMISMAINDLLLLFIWVFFFARFDDVNGWTFEDTQLLFVTHLAAFVFAIMFFGGVMTIAKKIGEGELDQFLVQPRSVMWRCLADGFSISIVGDLLFLIGMLIFVSATQGWEYLVLVPAIGVIAGWSMLMVNVSFQCLGFWFKRFERASWNYFWAVESPGFYPQTAIIGGLRVFLLTFVPSVWIITFPFTFVQERRYLYLGLIIGFAVFITLLATALFRIGLKHYESGNLMRVNS